MDLPWLPLLFAAWSLVVSAKWSGSTGHQRLREVPEDRAALLQDSWSSRWLPLGLGGLGVLWVGRGLFDLVADGPSTGVATRLGCGALLLIALAVHLRVRPGVLAVLDERDLPPVEVEVSRRRTRRVRQFGATALAAYVLMTVLLLGSGDAVKPVVGALAVVCGVVMLGALIGLAWLGVWRFGDEETVVRRR
ncbi:hypothetical protein [Nocardioides flavescens]|uniref:Uncharacterized protein n=1 Tax=Nocardioides flavescens TaxID=2691959 RepID=A0A6L7F152_9ACTN|nr:hypothetical protein [Nocardioides flavescens]MXG88654.1 hypothetical protein [Nocardioides flavescens]